MGVKKVSFDNATKTEFITIPGFVSNEEIEIEVQKPSMMRAMRQGKIPNELLGHALRSFGFISEERKGLKTMEDLKEALAFPEFYCEACMVDPTYEAVKDTLTDEQVTAIFNWALGGVEDLKPFRDSTGNANSADNVRKVSDKTK